MPDNKDQTPDTPDNKEEMFNPEGMQSIVDRLKAEGRMPTPELFAKVIAENRANYQRQVERVRREDRFQAAKKRAQKKKP